MKRKEFRSALAEMVILSGAKKINRTKLNKAMGRVARLSRKKSAGKVDWKAKYLGTALNAY